MDFTNQILMIFQHRLCRLIKFFEVHDQNVHIAGNFLAPLFSFEHTTSV